MDNNIPRDPFAPVNEVVAAVRARFERLNVPAPSAALRLHVLAEASAFDDSSTAYRQTFYGLQLERHVPGSNPATAQRRKRERLMVDHFENAMVLCMRARAAIPKPLGNILEDATEHCRHFDYPQRIKRVGKKAALVSDGQAGASKLLPKPASRFSAAASHGTEEQ